jgi:hypothetical protein
LVFYSIDGNVYSKSLGEGFASLDELLKTPSSTLLGVGGSFEYHSSFGGGDS